ncbi:MAG: hypothetical protein ACLT9P_09855 [Evtepia gabavorous]
MASYTPNLDLLKKSPVTDGDDMFNVETMLNENWDRIDRGVGDYTAPAQKMGLTGDLSVGASLGVLANIGNVHVWRKTVKTDEKIPATYSLGPEEGKAALTYPQTPSTQASFHYGKTITVDDNGTITINGEQTLSLNSDDSSVQKGNNLKGNFFYCDPSSTIGGENEFETGPGNVYFIPSDATISREPDTYLGGVIYTSKYQEVRAVPAVPPGTHVTYLTSVNRNAYQEGDDAKEAGYVLGEVVTGKTAISMTYNRCSITYCSAIEVNNNGTISPAPNSGGMNIPTNNMDSDDLSALKGKFFHTEGSENDSDQIGFFSDPNYWAYIPEDAVITMETHPVGSPAIYITKYQPVTGYPAIPAGTTIEYLGVLGDKVRMQMVSYVGTGTYGKDNPNSITADFKIKYAFLIATYTSTNLNFGSSIMVGDVLTTSYKEYVGFHGTSPTNSYGKKSIDEKTFYWYHATNATDQFNYTGGSYWILIIG